MTEPVDETLILDWTTAIEALDFHSVQELLDLQPSLLWTPLSPSSHLETDFKHFVDRLQEFKLLGTSIRPLYALHHILFDYGIEGDEWAEDRNELIDFILKVFGQELIQMFLDKGLDANKPNQLGHLPMDNDQPKLLINREKKDSSTSNKPSATSDRFRRLRELAESPNNVKNKANKERQNSTRRYFRPGHLEERKRRVLSEEEEAELKEKERLKRQREVAQLAQRSAVKNNPLFRKFEGQEVPANQKEQVQLKVAEATNTASVKDKSKFLNAADQVKRSSRVINILKDRSVVSTSVFRQQASDTLPKKVPSLRTLKAAKEAANKKKPETEVNEKEEAPSKEEETSTLVSPLIPSISSTSLQSTPEEEIIIQVVDENDEIKEPSIIIPDELIPETELDHGANDIPIIEINNEAQIDSPLTEKQEKKQKPFNPTDSNKSVLASGKKISIMRKNGKVKKIINVHENLNEEEKVEIYSTGKRFQVWKKDELSVESSDEEEDSHAHHSKRKNSEDIIDKQIPSPLASTKENAQTQKLKTTVDNNDHFERKAIVMHDKSAEEDNISDQLEKKTIISQEEAKNTFRTERIQRFEIDNSNNNNDIEAMKAYIKSTASSRLKFSENEDSADESDQENNQNDSNNVQLNKSQDSLQIKSKIDKNIEKAEEDNFSIHKIKTISNENIKAGSDFSSSNSIHHINKEDSASIISGKGFYDNPSESNMKENDYYKHAIDNRSGYTETTDNSKDTKKTDILHTNANGYFNNSKTNSSSYSLYSTHATDSNSVLPSSLDIEDAYRPTDSANKSIDLTQPLILSSERNKNVSSDINTSQIKQTTSETNDRREIAISEPNTIKDSSINSDNSKLPMDKKIDDVIHYSHESTYHGETITIAGFEEAEGYRNVARSLDSQHNLESKNQQNKVRNIAAAYSHTNNEDENQQNSQAKSVATAFAFSNVSEKVKDLHAKANDAPFASSSNVNSKEAKKQLNVDQNIVSSDASSRETKDQEEEAVKVVSISTDIDERIKGQENVINNSPFTTSHISEVASPDIMSDAPVNQNAPPAAATVAVATATTVAAIRDNSETRLSIAESVTDAYSNQAATRENYNTATPIIQEANRSVATFEENESDDDYNDYYNQGIAYNDNAFNSRAAGGQKAKVEMVNITPNFLTAESVANHQTSSYGEYKSTVHVSNISAVQGAIYTEHDIQSNTIIQPVKDKMSVKSIDLEDNKTGPDTMSIAYTNSSKTLNKPTFIDTNSNEAYVSEDEEDVGSTPTKANPYGKKGSGDDWNKSYDQLMQEAHNINFDDDDDDEEFQQVLKKNKQDPRYSFSSDKDESATIQTLSLENEARMLTLADVQKNEKHIVPDFLSKPYASVEKAPVRQSIGVASEAGSEQWFDPENDWVEEKDDSSRSSMTSGSFKNSSTTENTTIDDDEPGSATRETKQPTREEQEDPDLDYYSTDLYTKKAKSFTSSNMEAEGEILIFMQQDEQDNIQTKLEQNNNTTITIVDKEKVEKEGEREVVEVAATTTTQQPRIEDISHYMNALPKTQDSLGKPDIRQSVQAASEKVNIPNAHEMTEHTLCTEEIKQTKYGKIYIGVSGAHDVLLPLPKEITYARCKEHLSGYVHPEDGAIGQTKFAVDHMVPACYKKTYAANFDCFNSWYTRSSKERARREQFGDEEDFLKIVGKLNIEMLYLPVSSPNVQVPKSLRECDLTLKIRQWHDTCWQSGHLSTRTQGQKIWQRHYYKLIGSQLIGYTSEEEGREVWSHYNIADVIRLSAAADKVIVTLVEQETKEDKVFGSESIVEENLKGFFRLSFPDFHLDCVSDTVHESEEWVKTLKSMIGRVPLRLPFTDYY
ncbi:hypothetical protein RO3G_10411 [Rhizopus delemar RA 99-880]|uniref:PH domain-containing protein n=1 Tax=Rhizopus delemar (strain RA 99-880 / ATCC MYA-4621 / FGSC 9543 / NRRL 43880) TaxID=246409 RepID=I1CB71_RHIO9|nr:hypothetical protein RO3G_10411 [Rhizopus delemar RA 99-880]|eukprot:EIE85701.1 hypothetical protein RO3G_10411 [Rhizopus delemar RA 99-880]